VGHLRSYLLHKWAGSTVRIYCAGVAGLSGKWGNACGKSKESHRLRPTGISDEEERMKKMGFVILLVMATLLFTLAFPAAAAGPKAATPTPAAAPAPAAPAAAAMPEKHPHIDEALESMRAAKHHLESAEHDFDGHRAKAIEHLNQAIHEAEICMSMK
jgi:hypothetical protein